MALASSLPYQPDDYFTSDLETQANLQTIINEGRLMLSNRYYIDEEEIRIAEYSDL